MGANRARIRELGTNNYKSYGALKEYTEDEISEEMNIPVPKIQEKLPGILKLLAKLYTD